MDRTNTQKGRSSPDLRTDRRPSPAINQTTNQTNPQNANPTPKLSNAPRATHRQLPRIQTHLPTGFQQAIEVSKLPGPPTTANRKETDPPAATQSVQHKLATLGGRQTTTVQDAVQRKLAQLGTSRRGLECTAELDVLMDRLRDVVAPEDRETEARLRRRDPREVRMFWKAVRNGVRVRDEEIWKGSWDGVQWSVSP